MYECVVSSLFLQFSLLQTDRMLTEPCMTDRAKLGHSPLIRKPRNPLALNPLEEII
ncbi:hypothetical protein KFK09_001968 [Dendrobium nobile]|uniref:Uncharacterized protein n=1 Tax=Dendrobium nobile TaxID=94219 RepID=A0A8T3CB16_DENNO|nr:hypothetical protein KFK09_001968 [Dendrobium nobile]